MFFGGNDPGILLRKHLRRQASNLLQKPHNKMLYPRIFNTQYMAAGDINEP
jgi:hypothetical protein